MLVISNKADKACFLSENHNRVVLFAVRLIHCSVRIHSSGSNKLCVPQKERNITHQHDKFPIRVALLNEIQRAQLTPHYCRHLHMRADTSRHE